MKVRNLSRASLTLALAAVLLLAAGSEAVAQGQSGSKKKVDKAAKKLGKTAEKAEHQIGRNAVFCVLAAHTDQGTAQELKDKFDALENFPFGQFVAAVIMADRTDLLLDDILTDLQSGKSLGQIAKDAKVNMGEAHSGLGQFRSELARSMTNPPTTDCFATP
jgi:hypothetical protein